MKRPIKKDIPVAPKVLEPKQLEQVSGAGTNPLYKNAAAGMNPLYKA